MNQNINNTKICPKCKREYPKRAINCDDCQITLMKKTTYGKHTNDYTNMLLICPQCKKRYYPPNNTLNCKQCKTKLIENSEYMKKQTENSKRFNIVIIIICVIMIILVFGGLISAFISPSENDTNTYTCLRCMRTFSDSSNTWSISYSGFCEKCHDDVEFVMEVQDELEKW